MQSANNCVWCPLLRNIDKFLFVVVLGKATITQEQRQQQHTTQRKAQRKEGRYNHHLGLLSEYDMNAPAFHLIRQLIAVAAAPTHGR